MENQNGEMNGEGRSPDSVKENGERGSPDSAKENGVILRDNRMRPRPRLVHQGQSPSHQDQNVSSAVQRGLQALAETEMEGNLEEIKLLDTQLDHLNDALNKLEQKANEKHSKVQSLLDFQCQARLQRKASFQQRMTQSKEEDDDFDSRVKTMLSRCNQARRASVYEFPQHITPEMLRDQASGDS